MQLVVSNATQRPITQQRIGDSFALPVGERSTTAASHALLNGLPPFGWAEIAQVAYLNWQRDGCPPGRDVHYWLEAESELKATWHLLLATCDASVAAEVLAEVRLTDLALAFCETPGEFPQP
jgi:hypothetical protein